MCGVTWGVTKSLGYRYSRDGWSVVPDFFFLPLVALLFPPIVLFLPMVMLLLIAVVLSNPIYIELTRGSTGCTII
jgi:hypothetical protein